MHKYILFGVLVIGATICIVIPLHLNAQWIGCTTNSCVYLPFVEQRSGTLPTVTATPTIDYTQPTSPPLPSPSPTPTPTPLPPSFNACQADPNAERAPNYPIRIVTVKKDATPREIVQLQNVSEFSVDLTDWTMCSITGNQIHTGISHSLMFGRTRDYPYLGNGTIWDDIERDDGALYDSEGRLVSYWRDEQ